MANAARGEIAFKLGDETYTLRPTFGAVCEIEDSLGTNLFDMGRKLERAEITARELAAFARACLKRGHRVRIYVIRWDADLPEEDIDVTDET